MNTRQAIQESRIIPWYAAYFKVSLALKTPLVSCMDRKYRVIPFTTMRDSYADLLTRLRYIPDFFDCNAFAWVLKALAYQDYFNCFGLVWGKVTWSSDFHFWNCCITDQGVFQLEPQNGFFDEKMPGYWPIYIAL